MMTPTSFTVLFSSLTGAATVHNTLCTTVVSRRSRGFRAVNVDGVDAGAAARTFFEDEQFAERGFRMPKVCLCAKASQS
jgi:hypothetical protein